MIIESQTPLSAG